MFQVGPKEKCVRSLMTMESVRRFTPNLATHLCNPDRSLSREFIIDFYGLRYRGHTKNHVDWRVYFLEHYAVAEAVLVESVGNYVRRQEKPFVCMDIGANVGHRMLLMAKFADQVIATEAIPGAFEWAEEKITWNDLGHVKLFPVALENMTGDLPLEVVSALNFLAIKRRDSLTRGVFGTEVVTAVRGDGLLAEHRLPLPDFIRVGGRCDAIEALKGLSDTLQKAEPVVLVEAPLIADGQTIDSESLKSVLYQDVVLVAFNESALDGSFSLDPFEPDARKVLCFPAALQRISQQEACKRLSLGMTVTGGG